MVRIPGLFSVAGATGEYGPLLWFKDICYLYNNGKYGPSVTAGEGAFQYKNGLWCKQEVTLIEEGK